MICNHCESFITVCVNCGKMFKIKDEIICNKEDNHFCTSECSNEHYVPILTTVGELI